MTSNGSKGGMKVILNPDAHDDMIIHLYNDLLTKTAHTATMSKIFYNVESFQREEEGVSLFGK